MYSNLGSNDKWRVLLEKMHIIRDLYNRLYFTSLMSLPIGYALIIQVGPVLFFFVLDLVLDLLLTLVVYY